jgi:flagellar protein FliO/FliZ
MFRAANLFSLMRTFFLLFLALMAWPLWATENPAVQSPPGVPASSYWQAFLALAFIVAFLCFLAFLGRKFLGGKGFGQSGLRLLGGLALSPRERIVLVEAGDDLLVVGIVPGQIRTLHRMKKPVADGKASVCMMPEDVAAPLSFADLLKRSLSSFRLSQGGSHAKP